MKNVTEWTANLKYIKECNFFPIPIFVEYNSSLVFIQFKSILVAMKTSCTFQTLRDAAAFLSKCMQSKYLLKFSKRNASKKTSGDFSHDVGHLKNDAVYITLLNYCYQLLLLSIVCQSFDRYNFLSS